jgi:1-deoxyxylulose-5-phosphate synthase
MQINRREFLERSLALGAAATLPLDAVSAEKAAEKAAEKPAEKGTQKKILRASDVLEISPAKIKVSRMGIGTGTYGAGHSSNQLRGLGVEGVATMLTSAYEKGIILWDTADAYGTHDCVKAALKKVPREKVTILTKTDAWTKDKTKSDIDRFLKELGTDYIDILLLHTRLSPTWDQDDKEAMEVMAEAKQKKIIRAVGMSCHSVEAMKLAAKNPWLDICMVRINPEGERMDAPPATVLPVMQQLKDSGKGVIGIKVLGEGTLVDGGQYHNEALRFALTKSPMHCFSIGCETLDNALDNISRIEKLAIPA